ncbi:hypothetical protein DYY65_04635 [Nitrososphaera sp. AFS]|nr:hypothetical protein [Nitrososphaera sp. AFS]
MAEKVNHHPIIKINWRTVKLSLLRCQCHNQKRH